MDGSGDGGGDDDGGLLFYIFNGLTFIVCAADTVVFTFSAEPQM